MEPVKHKPSSKAEKKYPFGDKLFDKQEDSLRDLVKKYNEAIASAKTPPPSTPANPALAKPDGLSNMVFIRGMAKWILDLTRRFTEVC